MNKNWFPVLRVLYVAWKVRLRNFLDGKESMTWKMGNYNFVNVVFVSEFYGSYIKTNPTL